ncbi:hypothetical protein LF1_36380 [Rubripirellula obstinata]|uniref:Magnetosome protein MamS/MamX domain-containing protein n=1 Tax=Rubripirellula obstinata TaxID=406547 RepID=A0A5B1CP77_9BACT|nr:hypothetical protein [Rubripirellula obstinata]KAA1261094.1 hypothetical protein LF1_36380 [Rubripirellula obstinata]
MTMRQKKRAILAGIIGAAMMTPTALVQADEFGSNTRYYEDDAWYDVSEWFDGNDYNPTDEAVGRWDNETWSYADELTDSDADNDWNLYSDYGYEDEDSDSDWFYDYYDDGYSYWDNDYYSNYYDTDDDGLYDAYAFYSDTDGDGFYEDFDYYTFNEDGEGQQESKQQAQNQQKQMKSTLMQLSGEVVDTKTVNVRDRKHLLASVQVPSGQSMPIDLGPAESVSVSEGDQLTANGHAVKVGDKPLFVATEASLKDGTITIDRNGKKFQGTVEKTKTVKVRGQQHQLAKVNTKNGKTMMVDLGPKTTFDRSLEEGSQITVQGVPVKVNDRVILMARQIMHDGDKMEVDRQVAQAN